MRVWGGHARVCVTCGVCVMYVACVCDVCECEGVGGGQRWRSAPRTEVGPVPRAQLKRALQAARDPG